MSERPIEQLLDTNDNELVDTNNSVLYAPLKKIFTLLINGKIAHKVQRQAIKKFNDKDIFAGATLTNTISTSENDILVDSDSKDLIGGV